MLPPTMPSDPFFNLGATAVTVRTEDPFEIEDTLNLFLLGAHACVFKRNEAKFSTTFCIFMNYNMCKCKVRVYSCGEDTFSVELQRRSGDRFAFMQTYSQFGRHLSSRFGGEAVAEITQLRAVEYVPMTPFLSPLLEKASSCNLKCREEAACAFWMLADDPVLAGHLCDGMVVEVLANLLLEGGHFAIGYPAAMALVALSRILEGSGFIRDISERVTLLMRDVPMDKIIVARLEEVFRS
jgi:hypothetical protein